MSFAGGAVGLEVQEHSPHVDEADVPAFEITGPYDAPVVLALGGISANRHVCRDTHAAAPGWWDGVAGPGCSLDTSQHRVLGVDFLDGGSTPTGHPARVVSTHDQADAIVAVLDHLQLPRLHAVVGASYGGLVALALAERYPHRVNRLVIIGAAHRPHPMAAARRLVQRRIVELGLATGKAYEALALARALAMTTYRSDAEFERRFAGPDLPALESYLRHHGDTFARRFSPARFLALSLSTDLHAVDPARIRTPTTLVAAENDAVVPRALLEELAASLGAPCRLVDLPSIHGHDAFLTETHTLNTILRDALGGAGELS